MDARHPSSPAEHGARPPAWEATRATPMPPALARAEDAVARRLVDTPPRETWTAEGPRTVVARFAVDGEPFDIRLELGDGGALRRVSLLRWGRPPSGDAVGLYPFGCEVLEERTFAGLTVPYRMRAGWLFGAERFETEGEFFRAPLDSLRPL